MHLDGNANALRWYYQKNLYPFALIHRLFTFNKPNESADARTIAVQYHDNDNVYVSYDFKRATVQDFRSRVLASLSRPPESFHLGLARQNHGNKMVQAKKELVFDLDITDYDRYCACGKSKNLCSVCWVQMQGSTMILEHRLEYELGYKKENRLWVFSGRKGVHCFVNSPTAMSLSDEERKQLHKRLFIGRGDDSRLTSFVNMLYESYPEFVEKVELFFVNQMIKEQDIFALPPFQIRDDPVLMESFELFCLRHLRIHHGGLALIVKNAWQSMNTVMEDGSSPLKKPRMESNISLRKWRALKQLEELRQDKNSSLPSHFVMFTVLMPMIDAGPLKIAHQIKLPFSVHPGTKNISLPMRHEQLMTMLLSRDTLSLQTLCQSDKQRKGLPECFLTGLKELERWLDTNPK